MTFFTNLTLSPDAKNGVTKTGVGWHCKVCDCFLRDSHTYLDHINGRKHQRNLGYSMRVERSSKDQVSSRLALLAKEKKRQHESSEGEENFYDVVKNKDEELLRKKEERARERKKRRKMKKQGLPLDEEEEPDPAEKTDDRAENGDDEEEGGVDPQLAAMMGFSGFGGN